MTPSAGARLAKAIVECVFDELGAHVVGEGPADDLAAGEVDDRRQVSTALPGAM